MIGLLVPSDHKLDQLTLKQILLYIVLILTHTITTLKKKRKNPCGNLKKDDVFWLKDNCYSLYDTLGARKMGIT